LAIVAQFDACPIEHSAARSDDVGEERNLLDTGAQNGSVKEEAVPRKLSRMKRLVTSGGVVMAALAAAPAVASACDYGPTSRAFAQFGDRADYYLAPGGDFESLTWSSWGGSLVAGVNPFNLAGGLHSLELDRGEGVRSPLLCVSRETPHLRFLAKGSGGGLVVEVQLWRDGRVVDHERDFVPPGAHRRWNASRNIDLKSSQIPHGHTGEVTVGFHSQGSWLIDDVFIDPYRR
jgi:hypothetical protein